MTYIANEGRGEEGDEQGLRVEERWDDLFAPNSDFGVGWTE